MNNHRELKNRQHKDELSQERSVLGEKGMQVREAGEKLALDKERIDALREYIQESGLPAEEMRQQLAELDRQEAVLKGQFLEDVETPEDELEREAKELAEEGGVFADSARRSERKLGEFKAESRMDTSSIAQARRLQQENAEFFAQEQAETERLRAEQERAIAELRSRIQ